MFYKVVSAALIKDGKRKNVRLEDDLIVEERWLPAVRRGLRIKYRSDSVYLTFEEINVKFKKK